MHIKFNWIRTTRSWWQPICYDTANKIIGKPKMLQADNTMESDSIIYDMKTRRELPGIHLRKAVKCM